MFTVFGCFTWSKSCCSQPLKTNALMVPKLREYRESFGPELTTGGVCLGGLSTILELVQPLVCWIWASLGRYVVQFSSGAPLAVHPLPHLIGHPLPVEAFVQPFELFQGHAYWYLGCLRNWQKKASSLVEPKY